MREQPAEAGIQAEDLLRLYRRAFDKVLAVCDEYPGGTVTRRILAIVRDLRVERRTVKNRGTVGARPLDANEELRRRRVYGLGLTDRASGRVLGISGQVYQRWRQTRGLLPWRRRGRRLKGDSPP